MWVNVNTTKKDTLTLMMMHTTINERLELSEIMDSYHE